MYHQCRLKSHKVYLFYRFTYNIDLFLSYLDKLIENNADIIETDLGYHYKQMYPKDQGSLMFYEYLFKTNKKLFLEWRKILKYGLEYPH